MLKVAYGSVPKDGGTYTFFRNIRRPLLERGVDMRCVSCGAEQRELWEEEYVVDGCVLLAPQSRRIRSQSRRFAEWCEEESIDIVMGINSEAILSSIPHLPRHIRIMARCANAFDHGYRITMSGRDRLSRIVALSPRLRDDLVLKYGADPDRVELIPNGLNSMLFDAAAARPRGTSQRLALGFLGRLEHRQKGVLLIPEILENLDKCGVPFDLRIVGKGRDEDELRERLAAYIERGDVELLGALGPDGVREFLTETDALLFTSYFEGIPNALLEALTAGVVPIAYAIDGITDFVINTGETGFVCRHGDAAEAAKCIALLHSDRERLRKMQSAAAASARSRFSDTRAADAYARLFHKVMTEPVPSWQPRPWSEFRPDPNFRQSWTKYLPRSTRIQARAFADRAARRMRNFMAIKA